MALLAAIAASVRDNARGVWSWFCGWSREFRVAKPVSLAIFAKAMDELERIRAEVVESVAVSQNSLLGGDSEGSR